MWNEEDQPKKPAALARNLEPMSVDELRAYIEELQAEIARAEADITRKSASRAAAEAFFK